MAFATKYKTTIKNWDGDTITAEIQEDNFAGSLEEFTPVGKIAIKIEHQVNVNIKESYIVPSLASIRVYTNNEWDLNELLYATDRQFKVIIKNGSDELFAGWVIPGVNSEDYTTGQYVVLIRAIDGLADLKKIPYLDSGSLYDDFQSPLEIIKNCLDETGLLFGLWENNDIYGVAMDDDVQLDSPLNQSFIHSKAYGETIEGIESCWDVLNHVMQAFHCRIMQSKNLSGTVIKWLMSKLDKLGETTTYRFYNSSAVYSTFFSYNPLLTMGSGIQHIGGKGQISIKQGYKEINVSGKRGIDFSLLNGQNFEDDDFPTASTLTNWEETDITKLISTWGDSDISKETINGDIMVGIERYTAQHESAFVGTTSVDNGGGKVRINSGVLLTTDYIIIGGGDYKGIWKATASGGGTFDINADYVSDQSVLWRTINLLVGIEYDGTNDIIANTIIEDSAFHRLKFEFEYFLENSVSASSWDNIVVVVVAWKSASDYKLLDNDGVWHDDSLTDFPAIILFHNNETVGIDSFSIEASLSSSTNNFYSTGVPKLYVGLWGNSNLADSLKYNSVKISVVGGADKESTTAINADFVDSLDVDFFHTDGDGGDNDSLRHLHPIYDNASPKAFVNSWSQDGGGADNLEDIIEANLAASYADNSQIWSGVIEGDINISNAITDPLNFDRTFQLQKIVRNLETNFNTISMIEISPNKSYVVEQIGDDGGGGTYYFLSKTYGDISSLFTGVTNYNISVIRNKATSAILDSGGDRTPDGASSFFSGRVRILVSNGEYTGADVESKGMLRIL